MAIIIQKLYNNPRIHKTLSESLYQKPQGQKNKEVHRLNML